MATFLCVWELGGGLGHVMRLKPIAEQLKAMGHRVVFVVQKLDRAHFLNKAGFECIQAPVSTPPRSSTPPNSMAEILGRRGYSNPSTLFRIVSAWLKIYCEINPDLIITDFSPTAILAARNGRTPVVAIGNGFAFPPRNRWACNLRPWLPDVGLREIEQNIVFNINEVARKCQLLGINRVADLFYGQHNFIYELPETDIYKRTIQNYVIKTNEPNGFTVPTWKNSNKIRVVGYLKENFKEKERLFSALGRLDVEVILTIPGFEFGGSCLASNITLCSQPIDLPALIASADVVVFHAGGTIKDVILHGKVSLLAPTQLEQFYYARRMERNGYGEIIDFNQTDLSGQFERVINDKSYKKNVEAVSEKYRQFDCRLSSGDLAMKIVSLAAGVTTE